MAERVAKKRKGDFESGDFVVVVGSGRVRHEGLGKDAAQRGGGKKRPP